MVGFVIQDAGWGWGPASNVKTLFTGFARSGGCVGGERSHLPGDGGAVWGQRGQCGQVVAALARQRQRCGQADGWAAAAVDRRARVAVGADRRKAGPDPTGGDGRTGRAWYAGKLWRGVALLQARGDHV